MAELSLTFCKRYRVVPLVFDEQSVTMGYCDLNPSLEVITEVSRVFLRPVSWEKMTTAQWQEKCADLGKESMSLQEESVSVEHVAAGMPAVTDLLATEDEAPVIELLHALLAKAILQGASDVHIELFQDSVSCRIRVDGELRVILTPPKAVAMRLLSRVKVMAELDIAQKRLPQDGRMTLQLADHTVDVRVATLPTQYGERAVLRLLDKKETPMTIEDLGLPEAQAEQLKQLIKRPHGLVLVTGPTGSGKTTTLYAALRAIDYTSTNVMTVEDPVEYTLSGISQTPVNPAIGLTFSQGLRAILRQDPDVIMVGEIRDEDTAAMAVQASLTGHLVFSTLHTNTAVDALVRCRELGIPPYLLATSVSAVLAQRLMRRLCPSCMHVRQASPSECYLLGVQMKGSVHLAEPVGCELCQHTGYRGRFAVIELLTLDSQWAEAIHQEASAQVLHELARQQTTSLRDAACEAVLQKKTSLQECLRLMPHGDRPHKEKLHEAV